MTTRNQLLKKSPLKEGVFVLAGLYVYTAKLSPQPQVRLALGLLK